MSEQENIARASLRAYLREVLAPLPAETLDAVLAVEASTPYTDPAAYLRLAITAATPLVQSALAAKDKSTDQRNAETDKAEAVHERWIKALKKLGKKDNTIH